MLNSVLPGLIGGVTSGGVISAIFAFLLQRKTAEIQNQVRTGFERQNAILLSQGKWKETVLSELLGPIYMQLDRTKRAFERYDSKNLYLEARVLRAGNEAIRDLLLAKGHLIPETLIDDAGLLVQHYDMWLEEFEMHRSGEEPKLDSKFVFAGPQGCPFPSESDDRFRKARRHIADELAAGAKSP